MKTFPLLFRCAFRLLSASLVIQYVPALAHHSVAEYDMNQNMTIRGVVKEVWYNNPHVRYYLTVVNEDGEEVVWDVHTSSPNTLIRRGWTEDSIKMGDEVAMTGSPTREGAPRLLIHTVELADGSVVSTRRVDLDQ
jgi:hypothetical protein